MIIIYILLANVVKLNSQNHTPVFWKPCPPEMTAWRSQANPSCQSEILPDGKVSHWLTTRRSLWELLALSVSAWKGACLWWLCENRPRCSVVMQKTPLQCLTSGKTQLTCQQGLGPSEVSKTLPHAILQEHPLLSLRHFSCFAEELTTHRLADSAGQYEEHPGTWVSESILKAKTHQPKRMLNWHLWLGVWAGSTELVTACNLQDGPPVSQQQVFRFQDPLGTHSGAWSLCHHPWPSGCSRTLQSLTQGCKHMTQLFHLWKTWQRLSANWSASNLYMQETLGPYTWLAFFVTSSSQLLRWILPEFLFFWSSQEQPGTLDTLELQLASSRLSSSQPSLLFSSSSSYVPDLLLQFAVAQDQQ